MLPDVRKLFYLLIDEHPLATLLNALVTLLPQAGGIASLAWRCQRSVGRILQAVPDARRLALLPCHSSVSRKGNHCEFLRLGCHHVKSLHAAGIKQTAIDTQVFLQDHGFI